VSSWSAMMRSRPASAGCDEPELPFTDGGAVGVGELVDGYRQCFIHRVEAPGGEFGRGDLPGQLGQFSDPFHPRSGRIVTGTSTTSRTATDTDGSESCPAARRRSPSRVAGTSAHTISGSVLWPRPPPPFRSRRTAPMPGGPRSGSGGAPSSPPRLAPPGTPTPQKSRRTSQNFRCSSTQFLITTLLIRRSARGV